MIRDKVTVKNYHEMSMKNDFFIWHFLNENQGFNTNLSLYSFFDSIENKPHPLKDFLDMIPNVPYYESFVNESYDFLLELGIQQSSFWKPKYGFVPTILGFKKGLKVIDTAQFKCYCIETLIEIVFNLDPNQLLSLGIEKEDLE